MDLKAKFQEMLQLLVGYIAGRVSCAELQSFAWEVIDYFTDTARGELPAEEEFERAFWYAIWQTQHLCDDEHEDEGVTRRELENALAYMKGEAEMPEECVGRRP